MTAPRRFDPKEIPISFVRLIRIANINDEKKIGKAINNPEVKTFTKNVNFNKLL